LNTIIELIKKNRKVQALLLGLAALVVCDLGFYLLMTAPARGKVSALDAKLQGVKKEARAREGEYKVYLSYDSGRSELQRFKELLPRRSEYTQTIMKVYRMAKDDGMKSTSFGTEKKAVAQAGDLEQLSFSMPVTGSYPEVRKFVYDVETSKLFLNIESLGLSSGGDSSEISLTIGLSTYVRL